MKRDLNKSEPVLVIDDDAVVRELLVLLLGAEGRSILTAESGGAAVHLLSSLDPEQTPLILLTDLNMPGLPQAELAARLRQVCPASTLLVAMSGSQPAGGVVPPFDAFLLKPFSAGEFAQAIQRARTKVEEAQTSSPAAKTPGNPQSAPLQAIDEAIFAKLTTVIGRTQLTDLYEMFLDDVAKRLLLMQSAAAAGDDAAWIREAHAIKGGCGMLGATELHTLAGRMEAGGLKCSLLLNDFAPAMQRLRRILDEQSARSIGALT